MPLYQTEIERRMQCLIVACRENGVRVTRQRMEVFQEVARTEAHPDVETIHQRVRERMPRISLDTVYRTLNSLETMGLVGKVSALHGAARFDANTQPHHHFVCSVCGLVRDFTSAELDGLHPPEEALCWGEASVVHAEVRGICFDCVTKPNRQKRNRGNAG